jgi:hypothetical protein
MWNWLKKRGVAESSVTRVIPRRRGVAHTKQSAILTKRRKFLLVSMLLTTGMWIIQSLSVEARYLAIVLFALSSASLTAWSLSTDLRGVAWVLDLILPTIYPTTVAVFYFLLPQASVTRGVVLLLFAISMYGLLLTANIFAVAAIRTIQLLRAARAVGFLLSILTSALFFHVLYSLHLPLPVVVGLTYLISYPILLQGIWSYTLHTEVRRDLLSAAVGALVIAELALAISFWLIDPPLASVMLSMAMYVVMGIFQHEAEGRLFQRTIQEFIGFAGIVFLVVVTTTIVRWMY